MQVHLSQDLEHLVNEKVASGLYQSPSEMVSQGLRLLSEFDHLILAKRNALKKDLMQGINELKQGLGKPLNMDALIAQANANYKAKK